MFPPDLARNRWWCLSLALILAAGIWLRLPTAVHREIGGLDENIYRRYVTQLRGVGLGAYPEVCQLYLEKQRASRYAFLPPTRILFLTAATGWSALFKTTPLESVRSVSSAAGIVLLLVGVIFAGRLGGWPAACGVGLWLACSPLLVHLAHRALIDGFFALWATVALWGLWECLRAPEQRGWLWLYGAGLAAMVLTKENAAFAYPPLLAILLGNRWLKIGVVTARLWVVTLAAPALAAAGLVIAAGDPSTLLEVYRLNIEKSVILPYALATGDGPWHRYLLDFVLVNPAFTLLAAAALIGLPWTDPARRYLSLFVLISYVLMAQVRYGMNMRYGAMWELPLCWLAFGGLTAFAQRWHGRPTAIAAAMLAIAASELWHYQAIFVREKVYDPIAATVLPAFEMRPAVSAP